MADIVVCVPQVEEANIAAEEEAQAAYEGYFFWKLHHHPKYLERGEHAYFVERGEIRWKRRVLGFGHAPMTCETTGRIWHGIKVLLNGEAEPVEPPIKGVKPFRGFRYLSTVLGIP